MVLKIVKKQKTKTIFDTKNRDYFYSGKDCIEKF